MDDHAMGHVCVVEDELKVRAVLRKTLERAGFTVRCFAGADDCLTYLDRGECDLLVTDVRMPEKDGIELLAVVKKTLPWLPVLVVTGFGDVPMAVKAFKMGAADFIEKPLDRDTFLAAVRTLLARNPAHKVLRDRMLTRMEMKILYQILEGKNNREIADALCRSHRTVEVHRRHLMQKLKASNVVELLHQAAKLHLSRPEVSAAGVHSEAEDRA